MKKEVPACAGMTTVGVKLWRFQPALESQYGNLQLANRYQLR